jgi:hypothetical protein
MDLPAAAPDQRSVERLNAELYEYADELEPEDIAESGLVDAPDPAVKLFEICNLWDFYAEDFPGGPYEKEQSQ